MTALCTCLLAAYLLVPSKGHASSALVSVVVQIEARKDVVPMVLAETLLGLDKVCFGQTEVFGGSPLLLQVGFSLSFPFPDFHTFSFYIDTLLGFFMVSYLFFLSCKLGCDKVGLLTMPSGNWVYEAKLLSQRAFEFPDRHVAEWVGYLGRLSAETILRRCR